MVAGLFDIPYVCVEPMDDIAVVCAQRGSKLAVATADMHDKSAPYAGGLEQLLSSIHLNAVAARQRKGHNDNRNCAPDPPCDRLHNNLLLIR